MFQWFSRSFRSWWFLVVFLLGEIEARDTQSSRNLEVHIMRGVTGNHGDVSTVEGLQEMWMMPRLFLETFTQNPLMISVGDGFC